MPVVKKKEAGAKGYRFMPLNELLTWSELNDNILGYVHANAGDSVILMHDLQNNHATIEALPALIQTLKDEGYEICPIDDSTKPVQHVEYKGDK